jgi:hypothetical protein
VSFAKFVPIIKKNPYFLRVFNAAAFAGKKGFWYRIQA